MKKRMEQLIIDIFQIKKESEISLIFDYLYFYDINIEFINFQNINLYDLFIYLIIIEINNIKFNLLLKFYIYI